MEGSPDPFIEWRLYRGAALTSRVIGWFGHGYYSHVDVLGPDNNLWGSYENWVKPPGYAAIAPGYQKRPAYYDAENWAEVVGFRLTVTPMQYKRFWEFSEAQIGKPYDKKRLIETFVFGEFRDWRDDAAWWCSEAQAAACEHAFILRKLLNRSAITPGDFVLLLNQAGAVNYSLPNKPPGYAKAA